MLPALRGVLLPAGVAVPRRAADAGAEGGLPDGAACGTDGTVGSLASSTGFTGSMSSAFLPDVDLPRFLSSPLRSVTFTPVESTSTLSALPTPSTLTR